VMKRLLYALGFASFCSLLALPVSGQNPDPNRNPNAQPTTQDNRNTNPQTQDRNKTGDNRNLDRSRADSTGGNATQSPQPGTPRDNAQGNRPRTDDIRDNAQTPRPGANTTGGNQGANDNRVQGRVVRVGNNQFVVQTPNGQNVTLYTNPQTRYALNNRAAQFSDVRVGSNVNLLYTPQGNQWYADQVTFIPANDGAAPAVQEAVPQGNAAGQVIDGQIVRVIGQDQVVVRTADGKEIILYVGPQTTYTWNNQPGQFTNLTPGVPIQVNYEIVGNRPMARRILGGPRR